jgi:hypothetical protein
MEAVLKLRVEEVLTWMSYEQDVRIAQKNQHEVNSGDKRRIRKHR